MCFYFDVIRREGKLHISPQILGGMNLLALFIQHFAEVYHFKQSCSVLICTVLALTSQECFAEASMSRIFDKTFVIHITGVQTHKGRTFLNIREKSTLELT